MQFSIEMQPCFVRAQWRMAVVSAENRRHPLNPHEHCRQNWQSLASAVAQSYILAWVTALRLPAAPKPACKPRLGADSMPGDIHCGGSVSQSPPALFSVVSRQKLNKQSELLRVL